MASVEYARLQEQIREAVAEWEEAADSDSGDAEHEAARNMADILESLLECCGCPLKPGDPNHKLYVPPDQRIS